MLAMEIKLIIVTRGDQGAREKSYVLRYLHEIDLLECLVCVLCCLEIQMSEFRIKNGEMDMTYLRELKTSSDLVYETLEKWIRVDKESVLRLSTMLRNIETNTALFDDIILESTPKNASECKLDYLALLRSLNVSSYNDIMEKYDFISESEMTKSIASFKFTLEMAKNNESVNRSKEFSLYPNLGGNVVREDYKRINAISRESESSAKLISEQYQSPTRHPLFDDPELRLIVYGQLSNAHIARSKQDKLSTANQGLSSIVKYVYRTLCTSESCYISVHGEVHASRI